MKKHRLALALAVVAAGACQPKKPNAAVVKDTTTIGDRTVDLTKEENGTTAYAEKMKAEIAKRREGQPYEQSYACWTAQSQKIIDYYRRQDPRSPFLTDITIDELTAIRIYTGSAYRDINSLLRQRDANGLKAWEGTIAEAASGLVKLRRQRAYRDEVKRGASLDDDKLKPYRDAKASGQKITERAFVSSSYAGGGFGGSVKFLIKGRTGIRIDEISIFPNEKEVLFPPGAEFKVTKVEKRRLAREAGVTNTAAPWNDSPPEICTKEMEAASAAQGSGSNGSGGKGGEDSGEGSGGMASTRVRSDRFIDDVGIAAGGILWTGGDGPSSRPSNEALALADAGDQQSVFEPQQPLPPIGGQSGTGGGGFNDGGLGASQLPQPEVEEEVTIVEMEEVGGN